MSNNDMSNNDMSNNDMSSNDMSVAKAATALELAPALAVIGKVILRAQSLWESSWQPATGSCGQPATGSCGLSPYGAAKEAATQLIKVEDIDQEQVLRDVAELVSILDFITWDDALVLAERMVAMKASNSEASNSEASNGEASNSEGIAPLGAESP